MPNLAARRLPQKLLEDLHELDDPEQDNVCFSVIHGRHA